MDLIKNTGIQFISIPVKIPSKFKELPKFIEEEGEGEIIKLLEVYETEIDEEYKSIIKESINPKAFSSDGIDPDKIGSSFREINPEEEDKIYSVKLEEVLDVFEEQWVTIPYFKIREDEDMPFEKGPYYWCRAHLQKKSPVDKGHSHTLTLAFDTQVESNEITNRDAIYWIPRETDASDSGEAIFRCPIEHRYAEDFYLLGPVSDSIFDLYIRERRLPPVDHEDQKCRFIAVYKSFLSLLGACKAFPDVGLLEGGNTVQASLVLDVGNSRTCGILCETFRTTARNTKFDFTSARKLEIRNFSKPAEVCKEPFEMQVAFVEESFGYQESTSFINQELKEYYKEQGADYNIETFNWPSLVRVGPEAVELTSLFESEDSTATMSSPKRYLWDTAKVDMPWVVVDKQKKLGFHRDVNRRQGVRFGMFNHLTEDGKVITNDSQFVGLESRYSRSSLMTFALYEIFMHAISQINNAEYRRDLGDSRARRVLKDIVLTCPTAMTIKEQKVLRKSAKDAISLLEKTLGHTINVGINKMEVVPALPNTESMVTGVSSSWKYDEATCSQLAYLYEEMYNKFANDKSLFFNLLDRSKSLEEKGSPKIVLASIDIGGGTTDLMICEYSLNDQGVGAVPILTPKPLFWEGFNVAGDDIAKRIVESIFVPSIRKNLEQKKVSFVDSILADVFGSNQGNQAAEHRIKKKHFANQIAIPFAYMAMEHASRKESDKIITIRDVFKQHLAPKGDTIEYINTAIRKLSGVADFDLEKVEIELNTNSINKHISDIFQPVLQQLGYLISHFTCDVVLLSGRPSKLPVLSEMLLSTMAFRPDRIVSLGNERFGSWYPFRDKSGTISDPKTTVSVGAMIGYLSSINRLPEIRIDIKPLDKIRSTANYLGIMNDARDRIPKEYVLLSQSKSTTTFMYNGVSVIIGMRQIDSEDWIATPLYEFHMDAEKVSKKFEFPMKVTITTDQTHFEVLSNDLIEVEDKEGNLVNKSFFKFSLKTTGGYLHWKDSGEFMVR